jgi:hypothetical protein
LSIKLKPASQKRDIRSIQLESVLAQRIAAAFRFFVRRGFHPSQTKCFFTPIMPAGAGHFCLAPNCLPASGGGRLFSSTTVGRPGGPNVSPMKGVKKLFQ